MPPRTQRVFIGYNLLVMVPNAHQNPSKLWHGVSSGTLCTRDYQEAGTLWRKQTGGDTEREKYYRNLQLEIRGLRVDPGNIHVSVCDGMNKTLNPNLMQDKRKPLWKYIFFGSSLYCHIKLRACYLVCKPRTALLAVFFFPVPLSHEHKLIISCDSKARDNDFIYPFLREN